MKTWRWLKCFLKGHQMALQVYTDSWQFQKGGRGVVMFEGYMNYCECGKETFLGSLKPWYEGKIK
jgi:hypothetical protein